MANEMNVKCDFFRKQPDVCSTRTYYGCTSPGENQIRRAYILGGRLH